MYQYILCSGKIIKIMKIAFVFWFLGFWTVSASSYSQTTRVSLDIRNESMYKVFNEIQNQSSYSFWFESKDIDTNKKVSIHVQDETVENVLKAILHEENVDFTMKGNHILIYKKEIACTQEQPATAQTVTEKISGIVKDERGEPLIGVHISVKDATYGTVTDINGQFALEAKTTDVLVFSYLGYVTREVAIQGQKNLTITLQENQQLLDEVVIVGYGVQKKVNLTGSVATISAEKLNSRPITSLSAGLQGLVPGMTIIQNSGQPGHDGGSIRIRGVGTLNSANPMILVDGVEGAMDNLDSNDIESISVLKDASSAAIYGSKAANGVILITTKRGSAGKAVIAYNSNFGWQNRTNQAERLNSWEYAELYNEGLLLDGKNPRFTEADIQAFKEGNDPYKYPNTDWNELLYKGSGFQQQHNLSITGGADKTHYMASVGYQQQDGLIKHTAKKQFNARTNLDMNPVRNLDISLSLYVSQRNITEPTNPFVGGIDQFFRLANQMAPWIPYKDANGDYGTVSDGNPIAWIELGSTTDLVERLMNAMGTLSYTFLEGLSLKAVGSYRTNANDSHEFRKDIWYNPGKYHGPNKMYEKTVFSTLYTGDVLANFNRSFGKHTLGAMAGFHVEQYDYKYGEMYRQDFPNNNLTDINAGSTSGQTAKGDTKHLNMLSYFGRFNYDFGGRYLFEANVRSDASSRFAPGYRWGLFPSFSAAWRLTEEAFMEKSKEVLSNLKIRASWGKLGNQSALDYYPSIPTIGLGSDYAYPFNGTIQAGAAMKKANKKTITWEDTRTWGVGVDFGLWNNLNVTVDYYDRFTSGILMTVQAPATFGLDGYIDNIGEMSNKGIEVAVNYTKQFNDLSVGIGANFTYNKNEILNLGDDEYMLDGTKKIKKVGYAVNSFYGYKTDGLFKSQEEIANWPAYKMANYKVLPGDLKYVNTNDDHEITGDDRVVLGSTDPAYTFGFNLNAACKGFDFSAFFQGAADVFGYMEFAGVGEFIGDTGHPLRFWLDRWTPENPDSNIPRIQNINGISSPGQITSEYWVQNATYLRLKNLQFGYTFPIKWTKRLNISRLRVYYSGQNLLTFTGFLKGWDPESPIGSGQNYPQVIVNSFGLNLTF